MPRPFRARRPSGPSSARLLRSPGPLVVAIGLALILRSGAAPARDCIEYDDYVHWVGGVATPHNAQDVVVSGRLAYVADDQQGLQVIEVSNPRRPVIVGCVNTPGYAYDLTKLGDLIYMTDAYEGLSVIGIWNPIYPTLVSRIGTPDFARGVAVAGSYAHVADRASVVVIDVSSPGTPPAIGDFTSNGPWWDLVLNGDHAYVAGYLAVPVIDISEPSLPRLEWAVDPPRAAHVQLTVVDRAGRRVRRLLDGSAPVGRSIAR